MAGDQKKTQAPGVRLLYTIPIPTKDHEGNEATKVQGHHGANKTQVSLNQSLPKSRTLHSTATAVNKQSQRPCTVYNERSSSVRSIPAKSKAESESPIDTKVV
ncbi:hypothetical protein BGX28_002564 [Mortierella sp. GBA30]|nr:hypothetical protein BGX28_002564 [Mortierella sp. GBA30]